MWLKGDWNYEQLLQIFILQTGECYQTVGEHRTFVSRCNSSLLFQLHIGRMHIKLKRTTNVIHSYSRRKPNMEVTKYKLHRQKLLLTFVVFAILTQITGKCVYFFLMTVMFVKWHFALYIYIYIYIYIILIRLEYRNPFELKNVGTKRDFTCFSLP